MNVYQINLFLNEGHPVTYNERKYHDHIYLLIYDTHFNQVIERSAYRHESHHVDYFKEALKRHKGNDHAIYIIATEGGQKSKESNGWHDLFQQLGSQHFDFPAKPYVGILSLKDNKPQLTEWPASDNADLKVILEDVSEY